MSFPPRTELVICSEGFLMKDMDDEWQDIIGVYDHDDSIDFKRFSHLSGLSLAIEVYAEVLGTFHSDDVLNWPGTNDVMELAGGDVFLYGGFIVSCPRLYCSVTYPKLVTHEDLFDESDDEDSDESDEEGGSDCD